MKRYTQEQKIAKKRKKQKNQIQKIKIIPPVEKENKKLLKPFSGEKPLFIGRTEYIDDKIKNLLKEPGSVVSIIGIGGSGKSQLAFKALHQYYEKDAITDLVVPVYLSTITSTAPTDENNNKEKITTKSQHSLPLKISSRN